LSIKNRKYLNLNKFNVGAQFKFYYD
jgi:hypothetical protein